ncbi:MAG: tetratricopeptide repeat protein [Leptolyngbyaceae bacterium]|nr:tetratricopeptide repeat protein [Leptolyngbyaceae bacterium]
MMKSTSCPLFSRSHRWSYLIGLGLLTGVMPLLPMMASSAIAQSVPTQVRRAYTLLDQGRVDAAIAQFEQFLQQTPNSLEGWLGVAIAYRRAGQDENAFRAYQRVIELDPNNRLALGALGLLGGFRPEWQNQGIAALDRLLSLEPSDVDARAQRALLYVYQGRFGEAIADYEIVLQRNPVPSVVLAAAQAYTYSGNYEQGLSLFSRYQAAGGTLGANEAIAYALALRETGQAAQAVQLLEQQLSQRRTLDSTTINLRGALASSYAANRQFSQAVQVLTPIQGRQDSRTILARAYNDIGRYSGEISYFQAAASLYRQIMTQVSDLTAGMAREIADALSGMPIRAERQYALEIYRQLSAQYPDDSGLQAQQAVLEQQLGFISSDQLSQRLQSALQPFPSNPSEQRAIAQALTRLDSPDPILLPIYQTLVNAGINEPFLNFRIAQMYVRQGNLNAARNALGLYASTATSAQDQATAVLLQADIDRREGNLELSAQRYQSLVTNFASNPDIAITALQGLANIRQAQGRVGEALGIYDQIISIDPQNQALQLGRTSLAYQAELITEDQAEAVLNNWLAVNGIADAPPELYSLAGALPPSAQREELYVLLLNADPSNIPIQLRRLQVIASRSPQLARAQLERLIAQNPNDLSTYFVQGELAQDLGDLELAADAYESILLQQPNETGALLALGGVRIQQQRYDLAARLYNEALALEPNNQAALTSLAGLQVSQGRRITALEQLEYLQVELAAQGQSTEVITREMQRIREGYLQQRGFQPPWERY